MTAARERAKLPLRRTKVGRKRRVAQGTPQFVIPKTTQELTADQTIIKQFRAEHYLRQAELARALGVTRQTLSNYERGLHSLPEEKAIKILHIWQRKMQF